MGSLNSLETKLDDVFVKNAPALPDGGKKALVQYLPWINLALGILSLLAVYNLWNWAHLANKLVDYANTLSAVYGGPAVVTQRLTLTVWLSIIVLAVQAVLYIAAFSGLRNKKKSGWNLIFYALLVNAAYGVVVLFTDYGGVGNLIGSLVGTAIGLYFLFQIRASYK
jgi:hypothetical protein